MNDFVTFEIAKKLKEKGYPQVEKSTIAMYDEDGCLSHLCPTFNIDRCYYIFDDFDESDCVAPTISQVFKWLREEKNILLAPNPACFKEDCCLSWDCDVWAYGNYNHCCVDYKTYEKASIAGIEYVIDNLI